jgi:hypothetical protein
MTEMSMLWLPILLSAVVVFVVSSIIHMVSPWHKGDYPRVPDEDRLRAAVGPLDIPPGDYMVPRPVERAGMRSPEFKEKVAKGPNLILTVLPNGPWTMSRNLALWFLYTVAVGALAARVATLTLAPGAHDHTVFHILGLTAFAGYTLALWQMSIWYRRAWSTTIKATVDGLIYAALTAYIFVWLWPK